MQFKQMTLTTTITGPGPWSLYYLSDTNSTNALINALTAFNQEHKLPIDNKSGVVWPAGIVPQAHTMYLSTNSIQILAIKV